MKVGFCEKIITPKHCELAGYAVKRVSDGVYDDLKARSIVLFDDAINQGCAWVALDLVGVDKLLIDAVEKRIAEQQLPIGDIMLFASHTHSSCKGVLDSVNTNLSGMKEFFGEPDTQLINEIADQIFLGINESLDNLSEFEARVYRGCVNDFCASRHSINEAVDRSLWVTELIRADNKRALVYHFACHPTILHEDSKKVSADFVGVVDRYFEDEYDMTFFINGACADISTRFIRKSSDLSELERLGSILCENIEACLQSDASVLDLQSFNKRDYSLVMEKKETEDVDVIKQKIIETETKLNTLGVEVGNGERRLLESYLEGYKGRLDSILNDDGSTEEVVAFSILTLNNESIICIPGEFTSSLAQRIKDEGACMVFTLVNGYHSYITSSASYDNNYYESQVSFYKQGEAEKLVDSIVESLKGA